MMRLTIFTCGLILSVATGSSAQDATGALGGGAAGGASGALGVGGLGAGSGLGGEAGLGGAASGGLGGAASGGLGAGSHGGIGIGGAGLGANGGLGTGLNLRTPGASAGLLPNVGVRAGAAAGADANVPGLDISTSASGGASLRARQRRSMRPDDRAAYEGRGAASQALLEADLSLATRLSQIDRLRDHAVATGDFEMLTRADVLEKQARLQHSKRVQGETQSSTDTLTQVRDRLDSAAQAHGHGAASATGSAATRADQFRQFGTAAAAEARMRGSAAVQTTGGAIQPAAYDGGAAAGGAAGIGVEAAAQGMHQFNGSAQGAAQFATEARGDLADRQATAAAARAAATARAQQGLSTAADSHQRAQSRFNGAAQSAPGAAYRFGQQAGGQFSGSGHLQAPELPPVNASGAFSGQFDSRSTVTRPNGAANRTSLRGHAEAAAEAAAAGRPPVPADDSASSDATGATGN